MLETITATPDPPPPSRPCARSSTATSTGSITGRPGGLFTAAAIPSLLDERDDLGRRLADWVPDDHLL